MGAGASAAHNNKLRKALIMRAYNCRAKNHTLEDQFLKYTFKKGTTRMISLKDVRTALNMNAPNMDELFRICLGSSAADVQFDCFIEFLETGKITFSVEANPKYTRNGAMDFDCLNKPPEKHVEEEEAKPVRSRPGGMPPTPPRKSSGVSAGAAGAPDLQHGMDASAGTVHHAYVSPLPWYPGVVESLGFKRAHTQRRWVTSSTSAVSQDNSGVTSLVASGRMFRGFEGGGGTMGEPVKPLWRKREVVRSERTVHYTTVDASGLLQELVEKETTETEVLHMECRETGEFAHRETTKYEQQETFNDEVVAEEKGTEEYVHMKSLDDEIEYMESNMPSRGRGRQAEEPPPQSHGQEEPQTEYDVQGGGEEGDGDMDTAPGNYSAEADDDYGGMWHNDLPVGEGGDSRHVYGESLPSVDVHMPVDEEAPPTMMGATFEGIGSPGLPPAYSAKGEYTTDSTAESKTGPEYSSAEQKGQHKQRRKWSSPQPGAYDHSDGGVGSGRGAGQATTPWYNNDSDVEDSNTDRADDSGVTSGPSSAVGSVAGLGGDNGVTTAVDKDYLFAPAKDTTSESNTGFTVNENTHADILLQRYDSFKLD